jgi:VIT family
MAEAIANSNNQGDAKIEIPPERPVSLSIVSAQHKEHHSNNSEYLESAVLGMADGLTVPFALTAGLSSQVQRLILDQD